MIGTTTKTAFIVLAISALLSGCSGRPGDSEIEDALQKEIEFSEKDMKRAGFAEQPFDINDFDIVAEEEIDERQYKYTVTYSGGYDVEALERAPVLMMLQFRYTCNELMDKESGDCAGRATVTAKKIGDDWKIVRVNRGG